MEYIFLTTFYGPYFNHQFYTGSDIYVLEWHDNRSLLSMHCTIVASEASPNDKFPNILLQNSQYYLTN